MRIIRMLGALRLLAAELDDSLLQKRALAVVLGAPLCRVIVALAVYTVAHYAALDARLA